MATEAGRPSTKAPLLGTKGPSYGSLHKEKPLGNRAMADSDRTYLLPAESDLDRQSGDLHLSPEPEASPTSGLEAVTLSWRQIHVETRPGGGLCNRRKDDSTKTILHDVSGMVTPGKLIAIMGASGSGKTTLINVLTGRNLHSLQVTGEVLVNGEQLGGPGIQRLSAYVQQDDLFVGYVTVKEQLWFTAMLRMDSHIADEDRERKVQEVMQDIGLAKCADTLIGVVGSKKGISGGERKRLAFASEVLTNPALLFCDEPTSGLDSFMAASVVQTLRNMAARGKTILCTIHQPASEVFAQFDNLLLLAEGRVAYMGTSDGALDFFSKSGFPCPVNYNPADHFIATLAITPGDEPASYQRVTAIVDANATSEAFRELLDQVDRASGQNQEGAPLAQALTNGSPYKASAWRQFRVVTWRSWAAHVRDPIVMKARVAQAIFMAVVFGLIYLRQTYDQKGVTNINGALFLLEIGASMAFIFGVINTFPKEYPIFLREHQNGMYTTFMFYISKVLAESPTFIFTPALMAVIAYWMIGFYPAAEQFGIFVAVIVLIANVAVSFGYMVSCLSDNVTVVLTIAPLVQVPLMLFGGYFLNSGSVPIWLIWLKYLSWFSYANEILVVNQWKDVTNITCPLPPPPPSGSPLSQALLGPLAQGPPTLPCFTNGQMVIDSLSFKNDNVNFDFIMLGALVVGFRISAFIFLYVRTRFRK